MLPVAPLQDRLIPVELLLLTLNDVGAVGAGVTLIDGSVIVLDAVVFTGTYVALVLASQYPVKVIVCVPSELCGMVTVPDPRDSDVFGIDS